MILWSGCSSKPLNGLWGRHMSLYDDLDGAAAPAAILAAKLRPDDKMHVERLREIYGLGVTPMHEVLSKLTSLDLVTAVGRRGLATSEV